MFACPVLVWTFLATLRGRDIIWFIDNRGAAEAMIKGASPQLDTTQMVLTIQLLFMALGCRVWVEWIDSKANPADCLSRDDADSEEAVRTSGFLLFPPSEPPWQLFQGEPIDVFHEVVAALGVS